MNERSSNSRLVLSRLHGGGDSFVQREYDPEKNVLKLFFSSKSTIVQSVIVPLGEQEQYHRAMERATGILKEGLRLRHVEIQWDYQRRAFNGNENRDSSTTGRCIFLGQGTLLNYVWRGYEGQPLIVNIVYAFNRAAQWRLEGGRATERKREIPTSFVDGLEELLEVGLFPLYFELGLFSPLENPDSPMEREGMFFLGCYGNEGKEKNNATVGKHYKEGGIIFNPCTTDVYQRQLISEHIKLPLYIQKEGN